MAIQSHMIGTSYVGLANVEGLSTTAGMYPLFSYIDYSETIPTIDGGAATRGTPVITWTYGFVPLDLYDALRTICPSGSVDVYLKTFKPDLTTYQYYTAKMIWPALDSYTYNGSSYTQMIFKFVKPVVYTPPS